MPPSHAFFDNGPDIVLDWVQLPRQVKMQVECPVIDALQTDDNFALLDRPPDTGEPVILVRSKVHHLELKIVQPLVDAAVADQLLVRADLADVPLLEDDDLVGAADGGKAVGDHDHGAVLHEIGKRPLYQHFGFGVQMRRGFVQDQNGAFFRSARAIASRCRARRSTSARGRRSPYRSPPAAAR